MKIPIQNTDESRSTHNAIRRRLIGKAKDPLPVVFISRLGLLAVVSNYGLN
jgi:hypothetical protein